VLVDEAQDVVNLIVFNRASAKVNFVWDLIKTEFAFKRLKEATLSLLVFVMFGSIDCVLLLLLSSLPYLSNLLDFICKFAFQLEMALRERDVLLVASHQNWDLLRDNVNVSKQIVQNLRCFPKLSLILRVKQNDDGFGTRCFVLDRPSKVEVSWNVNKLCSNPSVLLLLSCIFRRICLLTTST